MKNKKLIILVIILVVQILTPVYAIASKNNYLKDAEAYKIKVSGYDPYDVLKGKYLNLNVEIEFLDEDDKYNNFKIVDKHEDGYLVVKDCVSEKPVDKNYYEDLKIDRYYMTDGLAEEAQNYIIENPDKEYYVEVLIKNGEYKVTGLFVEGEPIEEVVK